MYYQDDSLLGRSEPLTQTVDYGSSNLTEYQLFCCWKQVTESISSANIDNIIPSTSARRLENISWRAWYKSKFHLPEVDPQSINWFKDNDITWLYGPLVNEKNGFAITDKDQPECDYEENDSDFELDYNYSSSVDSMQSNNSLSSLESQFSSCKLSPTETYEAPESGVKSILKKNRNQPIYLLSELPRVKSDKNVKFNGIITKREIINNIKYDYDYFDEDFL